MQLTAEAVESHNSIYLSCKTSREERFQEKWLIILFMLVLKDCFVLRKLAVCVDLCNFHHHLVDSSSSAVDLWRICWDTFRKLMIIYN